MKQTVHPVWQLLLLLTILLLGCTAVSAPTPSPTLTAVPTNLPLPTQTAGLPTLLPPPTPPLSPTNIPTSTPAPAVRQRLAVPTAWAAQLTPAIEAAGWIAVPTDAPTAFLADGQVAAALTNSGNGPLLWQSPIALTVPWTTPRESLTLEAANQIMLAGDPEVRVVPWAELTPDQRALRVNGRLPGDPDYPLQERLVLLTATSLDTTRLEEALRAVLPADTAVSLAAVGDIMLDRQLGRALQQGNLDFPFAEVAPLLQDADLTLGNVESAVGTLGEPEDKRYPFQAPPETAVALARAGFDVVSLANNHGMDYGPEALLDALDLFRAEGVGTVGAGINAEAAQAAYITTVNGLTIGVLGAVHVPVEYYGFDTERWTATEESPGLFWADPAIVSQRVRAVADQVDVTILLLHSGYEYVPDPSPPQRAAAQAAIDAGADLVIGHHAHILQGVQFYNGGVIAYGLGNFAFNIDGPPETAVLQVWIDQNGVRQVQFIPAIVQATGQPRLASEAEALPIWQTLYTLTDRLN